MKKILVALSLFAVLSVQAASNAILELDCRYPESEAGGPGTASVSFSSGNRTEAVSVVYVVSSAALRKELASRSSVKYTKVAEDHYVSAGRVYTIRNIEKRLGLIDNACAEAISILVSKFRQAEPEDVLGLPSIELYLLDSLDKQGWKFTTKQFRDRSTPPQIRTAETYYFYKQE